MGTPVIFTEITKETDPIGGIWSSEPFAAQHVAWVPVKDHEAVVAALTEIMAAYRAYQNKPGPEGLRRIAAAESQADAALAKATTTTEKHDG